MIRAHLFISIDEPGVDSAHTVATASLDKLHGLVHRLSSRIFGGC